MNKKTILTHAVAAVSGLGIGGAVAYLLTKRRWNKDLEFFSKELDEVNEKMEFLQNLSGKTGAFATPEGAAEELQRRSNFEEPEQIALGREAISQLLVDNNMEPLQPGDTYDADRIASETGVIIIDELDPNYIPVEKFDGPPEPDEFPNGYLAPNHEEPNPITGETMVQSIWDNKNEPGVNYEVAEPTTDGSPYIISEEEFMGISKYEDNKISLMYYEGDDQLSDERDQLINDANDIVGTENLQKFGTGTRDPNALYIRNDRLSADIEVIRDRRSFQEAVLGVSPRRENVAPRKMRDDDQ